ncbi:MAG: hypothetical protein WAN48_02460 [Actinomycetes bacterium]
MIELVFRLVGVMLAVGVLVLAGLAVTGRVRMRSCCAVPAERDLRMRDAYRSGNS